MRMTMTDNLRTTRLRVAAALALGVMTLAPLACSSSPEDPSDYSRQRPPADRLDRRDRGLQSYDVVSASEQMANSLLSRPFVQESPEPLRVVVGYPQNMTQTARQDLQIFLQRLEVELSRQGTGKIDLIENRDNFRGLQSEELEQPGMGEREDFGGGRAQPGPAGVQPDYTLYVEVTDLPNRGTNFYNFQFRLTNMQTRQTPWLDAYEVRVAR